MNMTNMVDVHCHILPGIDDGSQNLEETKAMLKMAYDEGIRTIIATPHHHETRGKCTLEELNDRLAVTRELARQLADDFTIEPGMEVYFSQDVLDEFGKGILQPMGNSNYMLIEFSPAADYGYIKQALQQIQMQGYMPILAHVERYRCLVDKPALVEHLVDMGVSIQVNATSVTGGAGWKVKRFIKKLMAYELVHLVGTDAHNTNSRKPEMQESALYVTKKFGEAYANRIFCYN